MMILAAGGDARQKYAVQALNESGFHTGLCLFAPGDTDINTAQAMVSEADAVLLPIPVSRKSGYLNAPGYGAAVELTAFLSHAREGTVVLGGSCDEVLRGICAQKGLRLYDYAPLEELAASGAVSTAEAAIAIIVQNTPGTIAGSSALVIGAGRIGSRMAQLLHGMGVAVTVSARKTADFARIESVGMAAVHTARLVQVVEGYDIIVNTVPAPVLDSAAAKRMRPGCLLLDLASAPGGVSADSDDMTHIKYVWALGLPGKTAPKTAGLAVARAAQNILTQIKEED